MTAKSRRDNLGWLRSAVLLALLLPACAAKAEDRATEADTVRAELQAIQSSIIVSRERSEILRGEISKIDGDKASQNAALIAAAQRVKLAEIEVGAAEDRLAALIGNETAIRDRLDGADKNIANLLAALQRIGKSPPPALLVKPNDAVGSARGAILIAAILPQLRDKASGVAGNLKNLLEIRTRAETEEAALRANLTTLLEERLLIAVLIEARKKGVVRLASELESEEQKVRDMAARANTLGDLIKSLGAAGPEVGTSPADSSWVNLDDRAIVAALSDTSRKSPAVPFPAIRGRMAIPALGVAVSQFGADDGFGGTSQGISIVTRADAQVVAPADGWVLYKGPYLNYGQIIILNPGQGYAILLAGLEAADVEIGQFVMMGEPLGRMGSRTVGQAVTTNAGISRPTLYIELREHDTPLNPANWWAGDQNQTQTG